MSTSIIEKTHEIYLTLCAIYTRESRERRENRSIGDDDGEGFRPLVHRFGELLEQLLAKEPGSENLEVLEELVLDATDLDAWRNLIELTESAIALSPHLQAADA